MRIEELSIGDWVRHTFYEENVQIARIDGDSERVLAERGKLSISCHLNYFEPIPLTSEILEKNGFEIADEFADCLMYGSPECSIVHTKGTMRYRLEAPQVSVVCWNIHQLQRAMKLAGIEKEIEV